MLRYPSDSDHSERPSLNPFSEAAATLLAFVIFSITLLVAHAYLFIQLILLSAYSAAGTVLGAGGQQEENQVPALMELTSRGCRGVEEVGSNK